MMELQIAEGLERRSGVAWFRARLIAAEDGGQSLIEFAVTAPILLLMVTGIVTFALTMNNYVTLTEAASVGGRYLALSRQQSGDPCATTATNIAAAAPGLKNTGSAATGLNYTFTIPGSSPTNGTSPSCPTAVFTQGLPVTVRVTYPCSLSVFAWSSPKVNVGGNYSPGCLLTAQSTEVTQ